MKISFLIPAIVLYTVRVVFSNSVQVGTVLFTTTDLVRKCWTDYDKSLLKARAIMQDVLPDPDCLDFSNPEAVSILLDYFNACYQVISTSTYGKVQNVMYVALSDAFGGYLRAHVLPFVRKSYYGGVMTYTETQKLYMLYDYIRSFLKTDGEGWAVPTKSRFRSHTLHVKPLIITGGTAEACRDLYIIEKEGKEQYLNPSGEPPWSGESKDPKKKGRGKHEAFFGKEAQEFPDVPRPIKPFPKSMAALNPWKMSKALENKDEETSYRNASESVDKILNENLAFRSEEARLRNFSDQRQFGTSFTESEEPEDPSNSFRPKTVIVPLPVLDDLESPNSIAVPFKKQPFRNLKSESCANILENYYTSVIKCFVAKGNTRNDIKDFNGRFHDWLMAEVLPHLTEEEWYPGFGGVMKVMETMKLFGVEKAFKGADEQDYGFMFSDGSEFEVDSEFGLRGKYKTRDVYDVVEEPIITKRYLITGILITFLILFFVICAGLFYWKGPRARSFSLHGKKQQTPQHSPHQTLHQLPHQLPQCQSQQKRRYMPDATPQLLPHQLPQCQSQQKRRYMLNQTPQVPPHQLPQCQSQQKRRYMPDATPQLLPHQLPQCQSQQKRRYMPDATPQLLPHQLPQCQSQQKRRYMLNQMPQVPPHQLPQCQSQHKRRYMPDATPQLLPHQLPQCQSQQKRRYMLDQTPQVPPQQMPHCQSQRKHQYGSQQTPQQTPQQMPQHAHHIHQPHPQLPHTADTHHKKSGLINFNFLRKPKGKESHQQVSNVPTAPPPHRTHCDRDRNRRHNLPLGPEHLAQGDAKGRNPKGGVKIYAHHARIEHRRPHTVHTLFKKPSDVLSRYWTSGYEMEEESTKHNSTVSLTGSDAPGSSLSNCSAIVEDDTKCYSTEVQTLTCNCSGSCHCTTLTDYSSTNKVRKRKTSTVTILDGSDVNPKHYTSKSSTQFSTTGSGTEGFCSSECSLSGDSVFQEAKKQ